MPSRYLLDTNTASYVIKGNIPRVRKRLLKVPMAQLAVSAVTEGELRFWSCTQARGGGAEDCH
jgi:tRNA(fMet)-specific endonuclease VapC